MIVVWVLLALTALGLAAIIIHDYFNAQQFLCELVDEMRLARAEIGRLDRDCRNNPDRSEAIVCLTSLPSRLPLISYTIKSLLRQTRAPAEIRLHIPAFSKREQKPYAVPQWLRGLASLTIVEEAEDHGPATKFLSALTSLPADQKVIVVDDDRIYPADMIARLDGAATAHPDTAFGLGGWIVPADLTDRRTTALRFILDRPPTQVRPRRLRAPREIDIIMGARGYLVRPRFFDRAALADFSGVPPAVIYSDDIWLSAHCRAAKFVLPSRHSDFQPYRHNRTFHRSSLGWVNRVGSEDRWLSTITLKYLGPTPWRVGGPRS